MFNILLGGAAGDGIDTVGDVLERSLKASGYHIFTIRDFMSRIRGGHNFTQIRFGPQPATTHRQALDGMIALNDETIAFHIDRLKEDGFILCDIASQTDDPRAIKIDAEGIASSLGNVKAAGSVTVGAALRMFGIDLELARNVLSATMKPAIVEVNLKALKEGFAQVEEHYRRYDGEYAQHMLITGNQCLALGALAGGLRFYSGYPMSPSTSIMNYLSMHEEETKVVVEQAEDEIAAINMALGASYAGARAMTATSGGGFSLMVEALGLSGIAEIPMVMADIQRPGPATGLPTRTEQADLKFVIAASQGEFPRMVIAIRDHEDAFHQTARAFDIAERYQIPVILLSDQYLADATATIRVFDFSPIPALPSEQQETGNEANYLRYSLTENGISPRRIPNKSDALVAIDSDEHDERGDITESAFVRVQMVDKRIAKWHALKKEVREPAFCGAEDCETLFVGFGTTAGAIREAVETLNSAHQQRCGGLLFGDVWPLPTNELERRAKSAKRIVNVEQNSTGQLASLIRETTGIACSAGILKYDGRQISGEEIVERMREVEQQ